MNRRAFLLLAAAIALLAFGVREWYVLAAVPVAPLSGDVSEYLRYAYNLVHHGVFSHTFDNPVPDDFRGPGYPLLLAALLDPSMGTDAASLTPWLARIAQAQVVLGTLTVALVIALARQWLPRGAALAAGLLIALWPHHVVATGVALSEVLFGFLLVLALLCAVLPRLPAWIAGVAFGLAYLTNPLVALFPFLLARSRVGVVILLVSLAPVIGWSVRSHSLPPSPSRAVMNVVQGSWPDFHESNRWRNFLLHAREQNARIAAEVDAAVIDPRAGMESVAKRLASDPLHYANWYAIQKPLALWAWDIQLGDGGIYFLRTQHSPYDGPLGVTSTLLLIANPILTVLLLLSSLWLWRNPVALMVLYLTAIHVVFQAEPRYAIAYRPLEAIVVVMGVLLAWQAVQALAVRVGSGRRGEVGGVASHADGGTQVVYVPGEDFGAR